MAKITFYKMKTKLNTPNKHGPIFDQQMGKQVDGLNAKLILLNAQRPFSSNLFFKELLRPRQVCAPLIGFLVLSAKKDLLFVVKVPNRLPFIFCFFNA